MTTISQFRSVLFATTESAIRADTSLSGALRIAQSGRFTIDYAPFEYIQPNARLVIVGITPGTQQAGNALAEAHRALIAGKSEAAAIQAAKVYASFSGPMRANLVAMLDSIGIAGIIGLSSTVDLWASRSDLVHFTSVLRYPVYLDGKNYSRNPSMKSNSVLTAMLDQHLAEEARALPTALWVPLGPAASEGIERMVEQGLLSSANVIAGLPHPSGANAERIAYFLGRKPRAELSAQTSATKIDAIRQRLLSQVAAITGSATRF